MKSAPLLQLSVITTPEAEDAVVELLTRVFGLAAAVYTDEETKSMVASVYCGPQGEWTPARRRELEAGLKAIAESGLNLGKAAIATRRVPRQDWAESWKRHFKPIAFGRRLLIKPSWIRRPARPGQAVVILDPGLSFGTGNHPTTSFCLESLVDCLETGQSKSFWDIGTGSGILAIAASKLGYDPVRAIDFDREAVRVARENARRNGVLDRVQLGFGDLTRMAQRGRPRYDLICANLISNLLLAERDRIVSRLKPGGRLVLAGILEREFAGVQSAYEVLGLRLVNSRSEGEWRSGAFEQSIPGARPTKK